ncbi:SIMPL domain-containing protein [Methylosinus sp. LW4]|uniref:SIMPL domain-containing protein n=1 Tax=Methylosinus sp. LW4 TaxID=136993 RepID=UPI0003A1AAF6|nr:SIMPL domain-containing protein [Methylosinus sp. LW4]
MRIFSVFAICAPLLVAASAHASERTHWDFPVADVHGMATQEVTPDRADIQLGVFADEPTAAQATSELARLSSALMQDIEAAGVARKDIRSRNVQVAPVYSEERDPSNRQIIKRSLTGFRASTDFVVTTAEVDHVGDIIGRLLTAHANRLNNVRFRVTDRADREELLLGKAIANARHRAELLAEGASMRLGELVALELNPEFAIGEADLPSARLEPGPRAIAVAVQPGQERIDAHVRGVWRLLPK